MLCPMGLVAASVAGVGDEDTAAVPPWKKRRDNLFILPWSIGCPPGPV